MAEFNHLGAYLRQKRIDSGYSQVDLAEILGYSSSQFVSNWERGLAAPPDASLQILIKLLSLSREMLISAMMEDYKAKIEMRIYKKKKKSPKRLA